MKLAIIFSILAASVPRAHASCGSAYCPATLDSGVRPPERSLRLGYAFEYIDQDQPRIDTARAGVGQLRGHHDEVYTVNRIHRASALFALDERWTFGLELPWVSRSHQHIHHHRGANLDETWDLSGLGDLFAQVRYTFLRTLTLSAGAEFPTGATHFLNGKAAEAEIGVTPGSGSYDAVFGLTAARAVGGIPVFATASRRVNGRGPERYHLGDSWEAGVGLTYPVARRLGLLGQVNWRLRERDGAGDTREEVDKTGGEAVYLSPGLELGLTERLKLAALFQLPVYQRVNQIQLVSRWQALASVSYLFQL